MISGGRTKQLYIFCHVTGFMSDFLSFIDVELIRFFRGAIQFLGLPECGFFNQHCQSIEIWTCWKVLDSR